MASSTNQKNIQTSNIIPFKGVECVRLKKNDENFPSLSSSINIRSKKKNTKYNSQFYECPNQHFIPVNNFKSTENTLVCTKACKYVIQLKENGDYGVCYRPICSFAHSLEELKDPMCGFDKMCRYRDTNRCMFRHSDETKEQWLDRTEQKLPNLPPTSKNTRVKPCDMLGSGYYSNKPISRPAIKINLSKSKNTEQKTPPVCPAGYVEVPKTPRKNVWKIDRISKANSVVRKLNMDECYHSEYKQPDSEYIYRQSERYIIRVPSKELAKIAIQTALDNGISNIQVILE